MSTGTWATPRLGGTRSSRRIVIDALRGPDGITCARCRRARSVAEKSCTWCDANR